MCIFLGNNDSQLALYRSIIRIVDIVIYGYYSYRFGSLVFSHWCVLRSCRVAIRLLATVTEARDSISIWYPTYVNVIYEDTRAAKVTQGLKSLQFILNFSQNYRLIAR